MDRQVTRREALAWGTAAMAAGGVELRARRVPSPGDDGLIRDPASSADRLDRLREQAGVPGMSVAVVRDGNVAWTASFGTADRANGVRVNDRTIFQAASLTKPVFAYAVLKLCEQGLLSLDAPIRDLVPSRELASDSRSARITARTVLSHGSGLPAFRRGRMAARWEPGTKFAYSGAGYDLLQKAVERVTGQPLDSYVSETIFEPLGMVKSSLVWRPEFEAGVAAGHDWDGSPVRDVSRPSEASAAGSLHTTASDFGRFMLDLMSPERSSAGGLDYVLRRTALSPQIRIGDSLGWGLGWGVYLDPQYDAFWHFGDSRGFMCHAVAFPSRQTALVVFTNGRHGLRLCGRVADELTGETRCSVAHAAVFRWIYGVFYEGRLPE